MWEVLGGLEVCEVLGFLEVWEIWEIWYVWEVGGVGIGQCAALGTSHASPKFRC